MSSLLFLISISLVKFSYFYTNITHIDNPSFINSIITSLLLLITIMRVLLALIYLVYCFSYP